jgi:hypothetical protein
MSVKQFFIEIKKSTLPQAVLCCLKTACQLLSVTPHSVPNETLHIHRIQFQLNHRSIVSMKGL